MLVRRDWSERFSDLLEGKRSQGEPSGLLTPWADSSATAPCPLSLQGPVVSAAQVQDCGLEGSGLRHALPIPPGGGTHRCLLGL